MDKAKSSVKKMTPKSNQSKSNKMNLDHQNEPFSFHEEKNLAPDKVEKNHQYLPVFDNFLKSGIVDDMNKTINSCVSSTSCSISNAVNAGNARSNLTEKILSKLSASVSDALEQNISISQDLLKCKDAKDTIEFQRKMFKANFSNVINFYLDFTEAMGNFAQQNIEISSDYVDSNAKCFARKSN